MMSAGSGSSSTRRRRRCHLERRRCIGDNAAIGERRRLGDGRWRLHCECKLDGGMMRLRSASSSGALETANAGASRRRHIEQRQLRLGIDQIGGKGGH